MWWYNAFEDVNVHSDIEDDKQTEISKCISFCTVVLKTAVLIADSIFDHYVNDCIFLGFLEIKLSSIESISELSATYNTLIIFNFLSMKKQL